MNWGATSEEAAAKNGRGERVDTTAILNDLPKAEQDTKFYKLACKCPFCAEDIKEEAMICRHCGQVVSVRSPTDPLQKTLSLLEEKIGSLEKRLAASLNALEARSEHVKGHAAPALNAQEHCAAVRGWPAYAVYAIVAGFLAALASIMTFEIALEAKSVGLHYLFLAFLFLSTFCPFPFGVLTGMVGGRHTKAYIITGLGAGLISLAGHCVLLGHHAALVPGWHWLAVAILFPFGATALFLAGGLLGDRLVDRMNRRVRIGLFGEDLERLRGVVAPNTTREERFELTKALGPAVLTLIGTLTNSALVFIAATHYLQ